MNKWISILMTALCLLSSSRESKAVGMPTDPASLEAMVYNHKTVKAMLELRFLAEEGVVAYHKKSMKKAEDWEDVNKKLDKYRKCFEKIDFILKATATGFHAVNGFNDCSKNIAAYYKLLDTYTREILLHGAMWTSDTTILHISRRGVERVNEGLKQMKKSYVDLSGIISGVRNCTTADLMLILNDINTSIDEIVVSIRGAYMELWAYMTVRMGFWKKDYFLARSIKDIANDALGRWLGNSVQAFQCLVQHKSFEHEPLGGGGLIGGRTYSRNPQGH